MCEIPHSNWWFGASFFIKPMYYSWLKGLFGALTTCLSLHFNHRLIISDGPLGPQLTFWEEPQ